MERNRFVPRIVLLTAGTLSCGTAWAGLVPGPGYQVQYQINNANVSAIDRVSDSKLATAAYSVTQDVKTVSLNNGPTGPTVYTQPVLPSGSTFGGGFIATDGTHALTGQTGFPANAQGLYPGRAFLTRLSDGVTSSLDVPGNFDGTQIGGEFFVTASAGTVSGLGDNASSGVYLAQRSGGSLTGLNLVIDTGASSGLVAGDSAGNMVFSLGGISSLLSGGTNDLYRLDASQVAAGAAAGATTGLAPSAADKLTTGATLSAAAAAFFNPHIPAGGFIFTGISDLAFNADGNLFVGLGAYVFDSGFNLVASLGEGLVLEMTHSGSDYSAVAPKVVYTHDGSGAESLTYRAGDDTLWVSDGSNIYGLSLIPEPGTLLLVFMAAPMLSRRNSRRGPIGDFSA